MKSSYFGEIMQAEGKDVIAWHLGQPEFSQNNNNVPELGITLFILCQQAFLLFGIYAVWDSEKFTLIFSYYHEFVWKMRTRWLTLHEAC